MITFDRLSKKLHDTLQNPKFAYPLIVSTESPLRYVIGQEGQIGEGKCIRFYLLVDSEKGSIEKISYQVFGEPLLIAICEAVCEIAITKNYVQASRVGADLIEKKLADEHFKIDSYIQRLLNDALSALYMALEQCQDIILDEVFLQSPVQNSAYIESEHLKHWGAYSYTDKLELIKKIIKEDIEPYVALDQGGVEVKDFLNDKEVIIGYRGSCTSCFSATGATLSAINHTLKQKVHPALIVIPDMTTLKF
jgi:NifU-like protein